MLKTKLTKAELEVLNLITDSYLTIKQVSLKRNCSVQAIYKILSKLRKKGAITRGLKKVENFQPTIQPFSKIRLHGQEFNIKIIWQDNKYQTILQKSNLIYIDGNTIRLYGNSIEIYSGHNFFAENEQIATRKSLDYWRKFFIRLEHDLKIILVKPRSANIRIVNQHYARTDSELSESAIERGERLRIYAVEDGKLAFTTDDSFGFREDETLHPKTAQKDRGKIDKQINDWRLFNPPTNSQLAVHIKGVVDNQVVFDKNMQSHIKAVKNLGKGVDELVRAVKELKNNTKK